MNDKLTLQELIDLLAARHQMEPQDADAFVKAFWTLVEEGLKRDNYVKIKGLGTFKLIDTEARESIDIHSGERIEIQSHARITFTPDATLRDQINRPFSHFETVILNEGTQFDNWDEKVEDDEEEKSESDSGNEPKEQLEEVREEPKKVEHEIPEEQPVVKDEEIQEESSEFIVPEEELPFVDSFSESERKQMDVKDAGCSKELYPLQIEEEQAQEELEKVVDSQLNGEKPIGEVTPEEVHPIEDESQRQSSDDTVANQTTNAQEHLDEEQNLALVTPIVNHSEEQPLDDENRTEKSSSEVSPQVAVTEIQSEFPSEQVSATLEQNERIVSGLQDEKQSEDKDQHVLQEENSHDSSDESSLFTENMPTKKSCFPWCMVATILFIGILIGGVVAWGILSGRRYIPDSMVKNFLKVEKQLAEQQNVQTDSVVTPLVFSVDTDTMISVKDTLTEIQDSMTLAEQPSTEQLQEEEIQQEEEKVEESHEEQTVVNEVERGKKEEKAAELKEEKKKEKPTVLSDKISYKITGTLSTHTIRRGDSLVKLALKFYGNKKLWPYIVKHNRKIIKNPDNVPIGTTIRIPRLSPASGVR